MSLEIQARLMNTESLEMRKVEFGKTVGGLERPGDFCFGSNENYSIIYIWLPGVSGPDAFQIQPGEPGGSRVWGWDGNKDKPTLTPSIHAPGQWHGWCKGGRLESC